MNVREVDRLFFLDSIVILLILLLLFLAPKYLKFRESDYGLESRNSFIKTIFDKGNYGEFLTFAYLEKLEIYNKIMTNLYIPKEDGSTTEIDLIMITGTGIYVFESKNYSGWIFGDEKQKNWTQNLQNKQKYKFLNPIWQNKGHINALKRILGMEDKDTFKSYIVFSERCELKKINLYSQDIKVLKGNTLLTIIRKDIDNSPIIFSREEIDQLYLKLQEFAYADESIKANHIRGIKGFK